MLSGDKKDNNSILEMLYLGRVLKEKGLHFLKMWYSRKEPKGDFYEIFNLCPCKRAAD